MLRVNINGASHSCAPGGTILSALRRAEVRVPTLCDDPRLAPIGGSRAMGQGDKFAYRSAEEIWEEIRLVWPAGAGISYQRLEGPGLQWPCPSEDHPGTTILHREIFSGDNRIRLRPIDYRPTPEQTSEDFPLLLITGRALYQFNAATMSGRSRAGLFQLNDRLQISADDAARLSVNDGQQVRVSSRYGQVELSATISDAVLPGQLFTTFQSTAGWVNCVTGPHRDRFVQTPEYKVCAVRVEPLEVAQDTTAR